MAQPKHVTSKTLYPQVTLAEDQLAQRQSFLSFCLAAIFFFVAKCRLKNVQYQ